MYARLIGLLNAKTSFFAIAVSMLGTLLLKGDEMTDKELKEVIGAIIIGIVLIVAYFLAGKLIRTDSHGWIVLAIGLVFVFLGLIALLISLFKKPMN